MYGIKPKPFQWAVTTTLALRLGVSAVLALGWTAIRPFIASVLSQLAENPLFPVSYSAWGEALLGIWNRYDGYRYFLLASRGYQDPANIANTVFYPLYPMLIRLVWKLTGLDIIAISLILSTLTTFFALYLLALTVEDLYGSQPAKYAVISLAIYPTAFFLVGPYTESLFIALTLAAFYLARKERWLLAGLAGAFASLTRGPGIFTAFALTWVAYRQWRSRGFAWSPQLILSAFGAAAPGLAGLGFILWRRWMGFAPVGEVLEQHFSVRMVNPITGLFTAWQMMFTNPTFSVILDGLTAAFWIAIFIVLIKKAGRIPVEWLIYFGLNLVMVTSKVTTVVSPLQSIGRYVLVLFPGFIFLGEWLACLTPRQRFWYIVASSTLLFAFCGLYVIGFFVG